MASGASRPPIGILAGGGSLPREIADSIMARGGSVQIVAIAGEAEDRFSQLPSVIVDWGQIGRMLSTFRTAGCRELLIVGRVRRPDLGRLTPDLGLFLALPSIVRIVRAGGDDSVLRGVIAFFEGHGFRVIGPAEAAPELRLQSGPMGDLTPDAGQMRDIALGMDVVRRLGRFDVGQGAIVAGGRIEAIEGAEGTDAMLARVAAMRRRDGGATSGAARHGVLVKRPKPGQELRVDMPTLGPATITGAADAGLAGIAATAGQVLIAGRHEVRAAADEHRVFVFGAGEDDLGAGKDDWGAGVAPHGAAISEPRYRSLGRTRAGDRAQRDAGRAAGILEVMTPFGVTRCAVVSRGYALAVEAGEGVPAVLERVGRLRQWGEGRLRRRVGVMAAASHNEITHEVLRQAAAAGLAGIALPTGPVPDDLIAAANGLRLAVIAGD